VPETSTLWSLGVKIVNSWSLNEHFRSELTQNPGSEAKLHNMCPRGETLLAPRDPDIELLTMSSSDPKVVERMAALPSEYAGPAFVILDGCHSKAHVLAEMKMLRSVLLR
jgi:hypothetical protein